MKKEILRVGPRDVYKKVDMDDYWAYLRLCKEFFGYAADQAIAGNTVRIPYFGSFQIVGTEMSFNSETDPQGHGMGTLRIHWPKTKAMWEKRPELVGKEYVRYTNEHSNNILYRTVWASKRAAGPPLWSYSIKASRIFGKRIDEAVRSGEIQNVPIYDKKK